MPPTSFGHHRADRAQPDDKRNPPGRASDTIYNRECCGAGGKGGRGDLTDVTPFREKDRRERNHRGFVRFVLVPFVAILIVFSPQRNSHADKTDCRNPGYQQSRQFRNRSAY